MEGWSDRFESLHGIHHMACRSLFPVPDACSEHKHLVFKQIKDLKHWVGRSFP